MSTDCSAEQTAALMDAYRHLKPYPEAAAALEKVAGRPLAILSNGAPEMLAAVFARTGSIEPARQWNACRESRRR